MTNEEIIRKMKEDMKMRGFSHHTEDSYLRKAKDVMEYFKGKELEEVTVEELRNYLLKYLREEKGKELEEVTVEELRNYLLKYLREERNLSERSVNVTSKEDITSITFKYYINRPIWR